MMSLLRAATTSDEFNAIDAAETADLGPAAGRRVAGDRAGAGSGDDLIDEFSITLAPVLFGTGIRLFERMDPERLALNQASTAASTRVTHL